MATQQELDELQDKLDLLIIDYLDLFDKYQASRAEISRAFADGFFDLAQANFNAPNRGRYGQGMYDNRMQALRGVRISVDEANVTTYTLADLTVPDVPQSEKVESEAASDPGPEKEKGSENSDTGTSEAPTVNLDDSGEALKLANPKGDPLRWFGILRPMKLGSAQKNFTQSLPPIMKLVSVLSDIDCHEERIRTVRQKVREMRKELGVNLDGVPVEEAAVLPELEDLSIVKDKSSDQVPSVDRSVDKRDTEGSSTGGERPEAVGNTTDDTE